LLTYVAERKSGEAGPDADEDLFDIALEDSGKSDKARARGRSKDGKPNFKRQKRDQKFGFGGKKRFSKSGDAASSADMSSFSVKKMKTGKKGSRRLGKSRRAKA
jgi:rRNA-processing protein EBP2